MTDRNLAHLHPDLRGKAQDFLTHCHAVDIKSFIDFTWRSIAEQNALYAQGRTTPGPIVTHAQGGQSKHNFTLADGTPASKAFDFGITDANGHYITDGTHPLYAKAGAIGEMLGLVWGGRWPLPKTDYDHLELPD